jgi:tRNA dimethylallyltransferase
MAANLKDSPIVFIVGPTASGKTSLAIELAEQFGGEIICADSRTVYKKMDIGTAKPSSKEQKGIPHWGIDLVEPNERFTASDFKEYALQKIDGIIARGHIPFIVGGTGLYIDAVLFDYQFSTPINRVLREKLELMTLGELQDYCINNNVSLPENSDNKRYVIRSIEQNGINRQRREQPIENAIVAGIATNKDELQQRIHARTEQLLLNGVVEEAKMLGDKYGWESEAMTGNIYRFARDYIDNKYTLEEFKTLFNTSDWQLAKRQVTWLKRNKFIHWDSANALKKYIADKLAPKA